LETPWRNETFVLQSEKGILKAESTKPVRESYDRIANEYRAESSARVRTSCLINYGVQATKLTVRNESRKVRLKTEIVAARVRAAEGKPDNAAHDLRLTIKDAQKSGFFIRQMEASLALAGIETRSGKKKEARSLFQSIEKDARSKGFLLIARKASAASR
jgi:hypothetical protein